MLGVGLFAHRAHVQLLLGCVMQLTTFDLSTVRARSPHYPTLVTCSPTPGRSPKFKYLALFRGRIALLASLLSRRNCSFGKLFWLLTEIENFWLDLKFVGQAHILSSSVANLDAHFNSFLLSTTTIVASLWMQFVWSITSLLSVDSCPNIPQVRLTMPYSSCLL